MPEVVLMVLSPQRLQVVGSQPQWLVKPVKEQKRMALTLASDKRNFINI